MLNKVHPREKTYFQEKTHVAQNTGWSLWLQMPLEIC